MLRAGLAPSILEIQLPVEWLRIFYDLPVKFTIMSYVRKLLTSESGTYSCILPEESLFAEVVPQNPKASLS